MAERKPLVLVGTSIQELPAGDTLPATPPNGGAGGVLSGSYPNPGFAVDMATQGELDTHTANTANPHGVTKAQVGLGNVDNTADSAKPVSTAQQTALNAKQATLVSGNNIKTVNGTSLLGSGNVVTGDVTLSGVQTLANKTLNSPVFNDGYTEEVFAVTGTTPALSPTNGSIQTWALSGNSTPTAGTWASGQSITLLVDDGSAYTINWASMSITWKTGGGTAPALLTAGYTSIELTKIGTTIYGWLAGDA